MSNLSFPVRRFVSLALLVWAGLLQQSGFAETGAEAWLRYAKLEPQAAKVYENLPNKIFVRGDSSVMNSARQELSAGLAQMLGKTLITGSAPDHAFVLATLQDLHGISPQLNPPEPLVADAYWLKTSQLRGSERIFITAANDRGVLYGVFALLNKIARGESLAALDEVQQPFAPIRWVNQWDNLDGRIERGYGGASIFFVDGKVRSDLTRAGRYARLLASIGINGCTINNVNAPPAVLDGNFIVQVARIADVFRPWGVQLSMSVDLTSPKSLGGLDTFDPLDPRVAEWWRKKVDEIYRQIPDFGGFVVKADSEGRAGPSAYQRSHADAANVLARALKPHGGDRLLPRFRLQPSPRLARPEKRSGESGL